MLNVKKTMVLAMTFLIIAAMIIPAALAAEISTAKLYYYYPEDQAVDIVGSGFSGNSPISISITILESDVHFNDTITSNPDGGFVYTYSLAGLPYTYFVTATDGADTATTTFYDPAAVKAYTATMSPTSASAGQTQTYTVTITNDVSTNPTTQQIGSATIAIPSGFTSVVLSPAPNPTASSGKTWSATIVSGVIKLWATTGAGKLDVGEHVSVSFSATAPSPSITTDYTWTTFAFGGIDFSGAWNIVGNQPRVTVTAPANHPPLADVGGPYNGNEGTAIAFDASGSSDPDGDALQYRWDFDNDGTWDTGYSTDPTAEKTWPDDYSGTVRVGVYDGTVETTDTASVTVNNVSPAITSLTGATINENDVATISGSFSDPGILDTFTVTIDWGEGSETMNLPAGSADFSANHQYRDDNPTGTEFDDYTITITLTDKDGGIGTGVLSSVVRVNNVPPTATFSSDSPVSEGSPVTVSFTSINDPGTLDTHAFSFDWNNDGYDITNQPAASAQNTWMDNGNFQVKGKIADDDGGYTEYTITIVVNNVAPTVNDFAGTTITEGGTYTSSGSFADPGADTWTATVDYGDGTGVQPLALNPDKTFSLSHVYADNNVYTVTVMVTDDDGGVGSDTAQVTVNNVAPEIESLTGDTIYENDFATVSATFSDPGTLDTFKVTIDWGEGTPTTLDLPAGSTGFTANHQYLDDDPSGTPADDYAISVTVMDKDLGSDTGTTTVKVNNVSPIANGHGPYTADEGSEISFTGSASDPGTLDTFTYEWDFEYDGVTFSVDSTAQNPSYIWSDDHTGAVAFRVTDDDRGVSEVYTTTVTVNNVAPSVHAGADKTADEGSAVSFDPGSFDDPGADTWVATVNYGDESSDVPLALTGSTFSLSHIYADNGIYIVTVKVTDDDGGVGTGSLKVTVNNVAPVVSGVTGDTINENDFASVGGIIADPGILDTFTVIISWGDGITTSMSLDAGSTGFTATHQYLDDNPTGTPSDNYGVTILVRDKDNGVDTGSTTVIVNNVDPVIGGITYPLDPSPVGTAVSVSATFTDTGTKDTHTATWTWGDGTFAAGTVVESGGSGSVSGSHIYTEAGLYVVSLKVTDDDTGVDEELITGYIVIYDPSAGFVTGGGWIMSPAGAYVSDSTLTGKATFGFVSKYLRGANVPTGNTEFQFKAGNLNFKSTDYQWLVVSGARAQYKGTGTINGAGNYGFMLTVIDGQVKGGGGTDMFRIKIWDLATGTVVYDSGLGASETSSPTTPLGGGSIVIHAK